MDAEVCGSKDVHVHELVNAPHPASKHRLWILQTE